MRYDGVRQASEGWSACAACAAHKALFYLRPCMVLSKIDCCTFCKSLWLVLHSHQILIVAVQNIACIKSAGLGLPMRQSGWLRLSSDRKTAEPQPTKIFFWLQRAGHEPVCLVPGAVDTCMCLIALINRASTHILRALYSADIGIMNFGSPLDSVACCLMPVAGRPISGRNFPAFSYSSARRDL